MCISAIEISGAVTVRFAVRKSPRWLPRFAAFETPAVTQRASFATTGIPLADDGTNVAMDLNVAARRALLELIDYLELERGLTREAAYILCSVAADLRISEVVDGPNPLVSALLPLDVFGRLTELIQTGRLGARPEQPAAARLCWSLSNETAAIRIAPVTISCQKLEMPAIESPFWSVPMKRTPTAVPVTPPTPPTKLVPPSSTAAAELSGMSAPTSGLAAPSRPAWITPASPAQSPTIPYALMSVRDTLMPESRAASMLPPTA